MGKPCTCVKTQIHSQVKFYCAAAAREDGAEASDPTYDGASSGSEESGLELESREGWLR